MFRNTEMQKKVGLLFSQYPWFIHADFVKICVPKHGDVKKAGLLFSQYPVFIHADFVKIHVPKHGDAKKVVSFICTIYVVYTRKFYQGLSAERWRCLHQVSTISADYTLTEEL